MSRLQVISKICVLLLMVTAGWGQVVPPASLVTIPTAGTLQRGEYEIEVLMETGGGVLGQLAIGVSDQFMLGMSYGVSEFIGSSKPSLNRITPEAQIKYRLIEEDFNRPAIALGLDTQGYGRFQEEEFSDTVFSTEVGVSDQITTTTYERYEIKAIGAYVVASKNWQVMGNLGSHLGICKNVWEADESDSDFNLFMGVDKDLTAEFSIFLEYNAALDDNDYSVEKLGDLTQLTFGKGRGYLNAGIRWHVAPALYMEVDFNDVLLNKGEVKYLNRELKVVFSNFF